MKASIGAASQRRRIAIQGIVQGVGFRPFVYKLAVSQGLAGFVLNDSDGVTIEIEGPPATLDRFVCALRVELPPLARIDTLAMGNIPLRSNETQFTIMDSQVSNSQYALIAPDTATCADCLRELFTPGDRRYHYAFINCTNCGPRFTIIQDVPYDRAQTTMRNFQMCPTCQQEYSDPLNRRFHAQPDACPACGPQLSFQRWTLPATALRADSGGNAIADAAQALASGSLLALKGLGGYHLACDALNEVTVLRLRQRKHREARPFALMVPDLATARQLCRISEDEAELLLSPRRPIVLLERHARASLASSVAPFSQTLGLMLPYTPLHHLLLQAYARIAPERLFVLVMTSGNLSSEPIVYGDEEAQVRLRLIADGILTHNRAIQTRCDDSVLRVAAGGVQFFRRARGYVPEPLRLAQAFPEPVLACGGHLKNTFCLGREHQAFLSQHLGDLENLETLDAFRAGIEHFQQLFAITPTVLAYDLHPEYLATKYALESAIANKIGVQHHHAHIASVLAEHGLSGPVIGVAADGTGYGTDGAIWGCEIMRADLLDFERVAHLAYVPLPGGEQAVRQPWRMAAVYLARACGDDFWRLDIPLVPRLERSKWQTLEGMIARGLNTPPTSSLGRLFDAVAALLGLRTEVVYEGQAAIELETFAQPDRQSYPFALRGESPVLLDVLPTFRALVSDLQKGVSLQRVAGRFHTTIAELLLAGCLRAREQSGLHIVALSGGVFQNRLLLELVIARLQARGFQVYTNRQVPPNDGGLSLGQAAIAAARLRAGVVVD
jgi:hydrogenase maturation protein HypF